MQLSYSIQRWLPLAKELWDRNQHLKLNQVSASLAFTTILSLVPILTVGSYLVSNLPGVVALRASVQTWLLKNYFPGGISQQVANYFAQFSAKATGLTLLGSIGLLVTTIVTMIVIERAFNEIWQVKQRTIYEEDADLFGRDGYWPLTARLRDLSQWRLICISERVVSNAFSRL